MALRSYYLHQAQVCQSLANRASDPSLKDRYQKLALEFLNNAAEADALDSDDFDALLTAPPKKSGSGGMSPEE